MFSFSNPETVQGRAKTPRTGTPFVTFCLLSLWLALFACTSNASAQDAKSINVMGFDYPPFYQMTDGALEGIAVELGQELFSRLGIHPTFSIYPLKRTLDMLKSGVADATMVLIETPARLEFLHFTEPILTVRGLIWSASKRHKRPIDFEKLEDLKRYKVGLTRGYSYGPEFDKLLETMNTDTANSDLLNYIKLIEGRIDIFPANEIVAQGIFKQHPELGDKLFHSENAFIKWVLRIAISKKSTLASRLPEINEALAEIKKEGVIDKLVKKYTQ